MSRCMLFVATIAALIAVALSDQCSTSYPEDTSGQWTLWKLSGAFLQIFRNQRITCRGIVQAWRFRSDSTANRSYPIFSVWEQDRDSTGNLVFSPIGTTVVFPDKVVAEGGGWYRYDIPKNVLINVDVTRPQFIGIFYEKLTSSSDIVNIDYLSPAQSYNVKTYQNLDTSTIVGFMSLRDLKQNLEGGSLAFNSDLMSHDVRLPFIQAIIGTPEVPTTTQKTTTRKPETTPKPTTAKTTTAVPTGLCALPPSIENGRAGQPTVDSSGQVAVYECEYGFSAIGSTGGAKCNSFGEWSDVPVCTPNRLGCQLPLIVGRCPHAIMRWYYDRASNSCRPFFYSGCGGNANRFSSAGQCAEICGAV